MCSLRSLGLHGADEGGIPLFPRQSPLTCARIILCANSLCGPASASPPRRRVTGRQGSWRGSLCSYAHSVPGVSRCPASVAISQKPPRLVWAHGCPLVILHVSYPISMITRALSCAAPLTERPLPTMQARVIETKQYQSLIPGRATGRIGFCLR